jgi:hypothetical protein
LRFLREIIKDQAVRRIVRNTLIGAAVFLIVFSVVTLLAVETRSRRTFAASYPAIVASTDPAIVERGRYLVYGPAACAYCHVPREEWVRLDHGHERRLPAIASFDSPLAKFTRRISLRMRPASAGAQMVSLLEFFATACSQMGALHFR